MFQAYMPKSRLENLDLFFMYLFIHSDLCKMDCASIGNISLNAENKKGPEGPSLKRIKLGL